MEGFIKIVVVLGGFAAGAAVAGMCVVCLLVWLAGVRAPDLTEK